MVSKASLTALFSPQSVAVVGASAERGKIGHSILSNLIEAGYTGKIIPVNLNERSILGLPVVNDVAELPPVDLAVVCIPRRLAPEAMETLAEVGAKSVIVISAGFKEVGGKGYHLEQQLAAIARQHDMAMLGPNCLGLINTAGKLNATFAAGFPEEGAIAFFSQSGALCVSILDWALGNNIGFSKFVSLGNKAVLDEAHMLDVLADDDATRVILGYVEGVEDGPRFMASAKAMTMKKPVVMIKSGSTASGARAASSHTGAIAGSDQAYEAAFRQCGVIRAPDAASLFNLAACFSTQPLPQGPNLAIVTNSGGPGILAADAAEKAGVNLATLTGPTVSRLTEFLPAYASLYNPIDIIGDADAERYRKTMAIVAQDEMAHALLVLLSPTASVDVEAVAQAIIEVHKTIDIPLFACFMGEKVVHAGKTMLKRAGVPVYAFPEPAIQGLKAMCDYATWKRRPTPAECCVLRDQPRARRALDEARRHGWREIVEFQAQDLLQAYNLPLPQTKLARTSQDAIKAADAMGYPVVLKIASPQISHKSDVGGVKVGLENASQVAAAFMELTSRAQRLRKDAFISGCLVQTMAPKGSKEIIVGFKRDAPFGPLVLFGLGGVYVEVLRDVAARLAPFTLDDAREMIREIRSFPLLRGVRGEPAVDFDALVEIILVMGQLALDFPELEEGEFNPVLVNENGAVVADARFILNGSDSSIDSEGHATDNSTNGAGDDDSTGDPTDSAAPTHS